jgi:hypothetical protein
LIEYSEVMGNSTQTEERLRLGLRLTPHQTAKARADVLRVVQDNLSLAQEVLGGTAEWSPRQVSLFLGLLNKVIPPAGELWPEPDRDADLRNASVADLKRMLAEVLGEDGMPEDSLASAPAIVEPSRERDRREYFKSYEARHPERREQRKENHRRRKLSLAEVRRRIQARKAGRPAETMPKRVEDEAKRRALARSATKKPWPEVEREIRLAQETKAARRRGRRLALQGERPGVVQPEGAAGRLHSGGPPGVKWRGVRLDCLDTPLGRLVAEATGGQFFE